MTIADSGLRRVAVHGDAAHADLALPAGVPVAALIASIVELMPRRAGLESLQPYRLGEPGRPPLDTSKTLAQQGIRDGAVLTLTRAEQIAPEPRFDDPAEQLAAAVRATTHSWTPVARRLTAALAASAMSGVAGFVAVPGGPGTPKALLAVAAAGTMAALAVPSTGCGAAVRTTLCCLAGLAMLAAVAGMACAVSGISGQAVGAAAGALAVGLVRVAGRVALMVCGPADHARHLLTGLVTGSAAAVVVGTAGIAVGQPVPGVPRCVGAVFAALAGTALLLRARSHADGAQIAALLAGGVTTLGIALLTVDSGRWPAVVAMTLAGIAVIAGFTAPVASPLARRGAEVLESLTLGALVPLACWVCGIYGVVRGMGLG